MQTFLSVCQDDETAGRTVQAWRTRYAIADANFHDVSPNPSIGIDAVRRLQHIMVPKPYGGGNRLIVIRDADKATPEAQNALLKLLEEPPADTYIVLFTRNEERILSTIRSRSQIIRAAGKQADADSHRQTIATLANVLRGSPGKRILISQDLSKTKEETLTFLMALIDMLEYLLHHASPQAPLTISQTATMLNRAEHARRYVEGNVSFKATLDILFLGFPKLA